MADVSELPAPRVGDVGTLYTARIRDNDVPFNPNTATTKELIFKAPKTASIAKAALVSNDGTDWYLTWTASAGFHTVAGRWQIQAHLVFGDGQEYRSTIDYFQVKPNLN